MSEGVEVIFDRLAVQENAQKHSIALAGCEVLLLSGLSAVVAHYNSGRNYLRAWSMRSIPTTCDPQKFFGCIGSEPYVDIRVSQGRPEISIGGKPLIFPYAFMKLIASIIPPEAVEVYDGEGI